MSTPCSASASVTCSQANSSSRGSSRRSPSISVDLRAERAVGLAHLDADHAAAHDDQRGRGSRFAVVASRLVHGRASASPAIGGIAGVVPPARITARRASIVSSPTTTRLLAVEPAPAAVERDPALLEPGQLGGVVEVVDDLVAAVEHRRRRPARRSTASRRAGDRGAPRRAPRPGAAAPSTACRPRTSTPRRPCGPRRSRPRARPRPAGPPPPRRPAPRRPPPRRSSASALLAALGSAEATWDPAA